MRKASWTQFRGGATLAALGAAAILVSCATYAGSLPTPEQLLSQGAVMEDADLVALRRGRILAVTECAECHRFYFPQEHSPNAWRRISWRMGNRATLDTGQIRDLELYYVTASKAAQSTAGMSPDFEGKSDQ